MLDLISRYDQETRLRFDVANFPSSKYIQGSTSNLWRNMRRARTKLEATIVATLIGVFAARILHIFIETFFYVTFVASLVSFSVAYGYQKFRQRIKLSPDSNISVTESSITYSTIAMLLTFSFLATVPLNIDRSFSVWMLHTIDINKNNHKPMSISDLEKLGSDFLSPTGGEISRRVREQIELGNIKLSKSGTVSLTNPGKITVFLDSEIRKLFRLNPKYAG